MIRSAEPKDAATLIAHVKGTASETDFLLRESNEFQMTNEQAELEVVSGNRAAITLYEDLGFVTYGTFPKSMKYADGSYADSLWMMIQL